MNNRVFLMAIAFSTVGAFVAFGAFGCAKKQVVKAEESITKPPEEAPKKEEPVPQAVRAEDIERQIQPIHFDFDKYEIRSGDAEILKENSRILNENPSLKVKIEGHCDERGSVEYNLALGERRAKAARDYLVTLGIEKQRLSTISYGEERPADPGHDESAWEKNRRDEFRVQP